MQLNNSEIRIETTNRCNGRCIVCPREEMTRPKVTMGYKHFLSLIEQAYLMGITTVSPFGFGEPLLDKNLGSKISTCHVMGFDTFITTNATLLTVDKARELIESGLSHIRFSIHGIGTNYERVQPGFQWQKTMRNVSNFIKINHNKFDHPCKVSITVIPMNGESVDSLKLFWDTPGVDYLEVWKPHGWAGTKRYRRATDVKLRTCGRSTHGPVQIQADGKVIPCCFMTNAEVILGDTYKDSIEDIVKGKKYNAFRRKHEEGNLKGLPCENCDQLYIGENPLLYSSRDKGRNIGVTSSTKFNLKEN